MFVTTENDDVGGDAHSLELLHRMLGRLGLVLTGGVKIRNERNVNIKRIFAPHLAPDLTYGFKEGSAFNVAGRAADLGYDHIRRGLFAHAVNEVLDLVRYVRDHLHGAAKIFSVTLLVKNVGVDLAGREVGIFVEVLVDKTLVVTEVKVGLCSVLGHINLAVLVRAHGAGVNVDVRVELLCRDLKPAFLQKASERRRRNSFSESGYDSSGYKNVLSQKLTSLRSCNFRF